MKEDKRSNILAKPSGITLEQHSSDIMSEMSDICQILIGTCEKYKKLTGKDLAMRLSVSAKWHDNGKACKTWQEACRKDFHNYQLWKQKHPDHSFKEYSSENRNEAGFHLRNVGIRHEFYSLDEAVTTNMPISILAAIAAHHRKLGLGFEDKWMNNPSFKKFWNLFRKTSNDISEKESFALVCDKLLEFDTIRGLLQFADHRASAKEDGEFVTKLSLFDYHFPFADKRGIQKLVEDNWDNEILLVRAPTGAGKTTIVKLLMRFYELNKGSIMIDGHDIKDFSRHDLRSLFGMVLQDTWLFNGTIKENLMYGKLDASDEEVKNACEMAYVDHFVNTLEDGYDTVLDEETSNISQGQKQLLTIARAFLKDPKILILDEATSSVDTRTEVLIQKGMEKLMEGRTSFVIAHRLSTIRDANTIIVMKDGDIVEIGNHEELLQKQGYYHQLYYSQFETE